MQVNQRTLIKELLELTEQASRSAKKFKALPIGALNAKAHADEWSMLECIEHLNLYGDFYLPEIEKQMLKSEDMTKKNVYKSSFIGDFFVNSVRAGNNRKMKALKTMTPQHSTLSITTIDRFLKQLEMLKSLLNQSLSVDLIKVKTAISLTKFLKLRLGDTLRFLVYHNERHILQAEKMMNKNLEMSRD